MGTKEDKPIKTVCVFYVVLLSNMDCRLKIRAVISIELNECVIFFLNTTKQRLIRGIPQRINFPHMEDNNFLNHSSLAKLLIITDQVEKKMWALGQ